MNFKKWKISFATAPSDISQRQKYMLVPVLLQPPGTYHPTVHSQSTIFLLSKSRSLRGHFWPLQMQLLFTCIHYPDVQPKWHTCQPDYCWQKTLQQLWKQWNCNPKPWTWCPLQVWLPCTHIHNMNSAPFPGLSTRLLLCLNTSQVLPWTLNLTLVSDWLGSHEEMLSLSEILTMFWLPW